MEEMYYCYFELILFSHKKIKILDSTAVSNCGLLVCMHDCEWKNLVEPERSFFSVYTWMSEKNMCIAAAAVAETTEENNN